MLEVMVENVMDEQIGGQKSSGFYLGWGRGPVGRLCFQPCCSDVIILRS